MFQHKIEITVNAISEQEAKQVSEALKVIATSISGKDIIWVSGKIKEDPSVIRKVIDIANNPFVQRMFTKKK